MKYISKPIEFEAEQFTEENKEACLKFVGRAGYLQYDGGKPIMKIKTSDGDLVIRLGDWIAKSADGAFARLKNLEFLNIVAKQVNEDKVTAAVEIITDKDDNVLHTRRYGLSRIFKEGQSFILDNKNYRVLLSATTQGQYGGVLVEHVVKQVSRSCKVDGRCDPACDIDCDLEG